jgi:hypothetical protein
MEGQSLEGGLGVEKGDEEEEVMVVEDEDDDEDDGEDEDVVGRDAEVEVALKDEPGPGVLVVFLGR